MFFLKSWVQMYVSNLMATLQALPHCTTATAGQDNAPCRQNLKTGHGIRGRTKVGTTGAPFAINPKVVVLHVVQDDFFNLSKKS